MNDLTLVTGIADIGRAELPTRFARPFEFYLNGLRALLGLDLPMVVYVDPRHESVVAGRVAPTRIVHIESDDFERFDRPAMDAIRTSKGWLAQAGWLAESPQARLPLYNPLVMSKLRWLAAQARDNPFGTRHFAWIDGGINHTVPIDLLRNALEGDRVLSYLRRFLFVCYPYAGATEVHGFERAALSRYANVAKVEWVARGGFFGGQADYIAEAARLYEATLRHTLEHGYMGTEESVFTILGHLHPGVFDCFLIGANGMVATFFADVVREAA